MRKRNCVLKKITGLVLTTAMLLSSSGTDWAFQKAGDISEGTVTQEVSTSSQYGLADDIQDGVILHCFDWKYNDIRAELSKIAAAGFTTVQTSPAQVGVAGGAWYWLYQPIGFYAGDNAVGTKEELRSLCSEADKYGIKIIVDVVANSLAGDHTKIQEELRDNKFWHNEGGITDYMDRYQVTHGDVGMQDINSEDVTVQQYVANYVKELKSLGVDGIRWDAAKHISLKSEGCYFWSEVTKEGLYNYGEILGGPDDRTSGNESLMKEYTGYMTVTDSNYGKLLRDSFFEGNVPGAGGNWISRGIADKNLLYWAESHDTWCNNKEDGYSNEMSQNVIDRAYAVAASRNNITALYFSRPSSPIKENIFAGEKGSTHFESKEVAAVNHFHNAMIGQKDYYTTSDGCAVITREKGAVIVKGSGCGNVSVSNGGAVTEPGTYTDEITGNQFTVTSTTITGEVGASGIAVVYNPDIDPAPTITPASQNFTTDTIDITIGLKNASSGTFQVGNAPTKTYTSDVKFSLGSDMNYGDSVTVTLTATNGEVTTPPQKFTYTKVDPKQVYIAYIDKPSNWSGTLYCYATDETTNPLSKNAEWPGVKMDLDSVTGYYKCVLPDSMTSPKVVFNTGTYGTYRYPADQQPGLEFSSNSMLYSAGQWQQYPTEKKGTVKVKYVDTAGKEIADSAILEGKIGNAYNAEPKEISGYNLKTSPTNEFGQYTEEAITVTFVYEEKDKVPTGDTLYAVKPSDWDKIYCYAYTALNNKNAEWPGVEMTFDSDLGLYKYDIPDNLSDVYVVISDNAGHQDPGVCQQGFALSGTMIYADGELEEYSPGTSFTKKGKVITKYVDEYGVQLTSAVTTKGNINDTYTTSPADITGYSLIETPSNSSGIYTDENITVTYRYKQIKSLNITSLSADKSSSSAIEGEKINFYAVAVDSSSSVQFKFTVIDENQNKMVISDYSYSNSAEWVAKAGTYTIRVEAKDGTTEAVKFIDGYVVKAKESIDPDPGTDRGDIVPMINSISTDIDSEKAKLGDKIHISANASGNGELLYKFTYTVAEEDEEDEEEEVISDYSSSSSVEWIPIEAGEYKLSVYVKDNNSNISRRDLNGYIVSSKDKSEIVINSFTADKKSGEVKVGEKILLSSNATSDQSALSYKFAYNLNGSVYTISDYSTNNSAEWIPQKEGTYDIIVYVSDKDLNTDFRSIYSFVVNKDDNNSTDSSEEDSESTNKPTESTEPIESTEEDTDPSVDDTKADTENTDPTETTESNGKLAVTALELDKESGNAIAGNKIQVKASITGNKGTVKYKFTARKAGQKEKVIRAYGESAKCVWQPDSSGYYVITVYAIDDNNLAAKYSNSFYKVEQGLSLKSISINTKNGKAIVNKSIVLKSKAAGGIGTKFYRFMYKINGKKKYICNFGSSSNTNWRPTKAGKYCIYAEVTDALGNKATKAVLNYTVTTPLKVSNVSFSVKSAKLKSGKATKITVKSTGGYGKCNYQIVSVCNRKKTVLKKYSSSKTISWKAKKAGKYTIKVYVKDQVGTVAVKTCKYIVK